MDKPYLNMARDLLEIVMASVLDPGSERKIRDDFARTLAFQNRGWRAEIMREQGLPPQGHYSDKRCIPAHVRVVDPRLP